MQIEDLSTAVFVAGDINLVLGSTSTDQLQELLERLLPLLRTPGAHVEDGVFQTGAARLQLRAGAGDNLRQYVQKRSPADDREAIEQHLVRLCLDPDCVRWQSEYVVLSGGYYAGPVDLPRNYYARYTVGDVPERKVQKEPLPDVRAALTTRDARFQTPGRLILLAQPGAGKTTVLRRLAGDLALARLQDAGGHFPFYTSLALQGEAETAWGFLERAWREQLPHAGVGALHDLRQSGQLCLLLDGVNEMRTGRMTQRLAEWRQLAQTLPAGNQLAFACRSDDYGSTYLGVQQVEIDPLTPQKIEEYACTVFADDNKGAAFMQELQGPHADLLWMAQIPFYLQRLVEEYGAHGSLPSHRAELLLNVVTRIFLREADRQPAEEWIDLRAQRDALAELAFTMQERGEGTVAAQSLWQAAVPAQVTVDHRSVLTPALAVVTLACRAGLLRWVDGDESTATEADAEAGADAPDPDELAEEGERIRFHHQLFQEYFAAEALCRRFVGARRRCVAGTSDALWRVPCGSDEVADPPRGEWEPLPAAPVSRWEQTTILAAGLQAGLVECVRRVNPALAARCLLELPGGQDHPAFDPCRQDLLDRLGSVQVHLRSRIETGLLLGRLDDPRFPVEEISGVRVIRPPLVPIDTQGAVVGSRPGTPDADRDEQPRHAVALAPYAIGRYPVTVAEYACFIAAGGYKEEQERFWTKGGKHWRRGEPVPGDPDPLEWYMQTYRRRKQNPQEIEDYLQQGVLTEMGARNWRRYITYDEARFEKIVRNWYYSGAAPVQPNLWEDDAYNNGSQPVVSVTWYEAAAYANWLAAVTSEPYRLCSEAEWEWAAGGGVRVYPWGDGWDAGRLNSIEGRVLRTTPVGAYPHGATPGGIHDLAGNVWEWTATIYDPDAYAEDAVSPRLREDLDGTGYRVVRGGGWAAKREWVRCAYRLGSIPRNGTSTRDFDLPELSREAVVFCLLFAVFCFLSF